MKARYYDVSSYGQKSKERFDFLETYSLSRELQRKIDTTFICFNRVALTSSLLA